MEETMPVRHAAAIRMIQEYYSRNVLSEICSTVFELQTTRSIIVYNRCLLKIRKKDYDCINMNTRRILGGVFFLLLLIGAGFWYKTKNESSQLSLAPQRIFSLDKQFIPKGAAPLEVDKALAVFGFPKPLPFFDKNNVVQSLNLEASEPAPTSTPLSYAQNIENIVVGNNKTNSTTPSPVPNGYSSLFLSYRVVGQNTTVLRSVFIEYFKSMGWKMDDAHSASDLVFVSDKGQILSVALMEVSQKSEVGQHIVVAISPL